MSTTTNICYKCETAFTTLLAAQTFTNIASTSIYDGIRHAEIEEGEQNTKVYPHVVVACQSADAPGDLSGNWIATVKVSVVSNADDTTAADHNTNCEEVFDTVFTTTVAADISATVTGFTAFLVVPESMDWEVDNRSWVSTYTLKIDCAGSDIT